MQFLRFLTVYRQLRSYYGEDRSSLSFAMERDNLYYHTECAETTGGDFGIHRCSMPCNQIDIMTLPRSHFHVPHVLIAALWYVTGPFHCFIAAKCPPRIYLMPMSC